MYGHYWGMHTFWWMFWLIAIVAFSYWAWRSEPEERDTALEELRRKFASGEITEDEYRKRLDVLRSTDRSPRTRRAV